MLQEELGSAPFILKTKCEIHKHTDKNLLTKLKFATPCRKLIGVPMGSIQAKPARKEKDGERMM